MNYDLKENIKGMVEFQYLRDGALWYQTPTGMLFPVPLTDVAGDERVTLNRTEKGMLLMKWIRKYIASVNDPIAV